MMINALLAHAEQLHKESCEALFIDNPNWPGERQAAYAYGPIRGMFKEKDAMLMAALESAPDFERIKKLLLWSIKDTEQEIKQRFEGQGYLVQVESPDILILKDSSGDTYRHECRDHTSNVKNAKTLDELKTAVMNYNAGLFDQVTDESLEIQMRYLQLYLEYKKYRKDKEIEGWFEIEQPELDALYDTMFSKESEYKTYGLIPIDDTRELKVMIPPRIYDKEIDKTIILCVNNVVAEDIYELYTKQLIGRMSFRALGEIHDGNYTLQNITETVERGCPFDFKLNTLDDVTKLYSVDYNDQLWIRRDGINIYFEELDSDFQCYKDYVVTRLLHIEFGEADRDYPIIQHMDFEHIFYTIDEYEHRQYKADKKGSGKRKKIFKLDGCRIPIDYKVKMLAPDYSEKDVLFLIEILQTFFEHKDLLHEYFAKIA